MIFQKFFLVFCFLVTSKIFSESKEEIKDRIQDKLESGVEHAGLGIVGIGIGAFEATRGDPVGAAGVIGGSLYEFKEATRDFREAKELFNHAREMEENEKTTNL